MSWAAEKYNKIPNLLLYFSKTVFGSNLHPLEFFRQLTIFDLDVIFPKSILFRSFKVNRGDLMSIKVTYSDVIKLRKILIMIDTTLTSLDISDVDTVWTGGRGKRPPR